MQSEVLCPNLFKYLPNQMIRMTSYINITNDLDKYIMCTYMYMYLYMYRLYHEVEISTGFIH